MGTVMLKPKFTWEKRSVNVKDVLQSQLCRVCEATLLCFWSRILQQAVALVSGWSVIGSSLG